MPLYTAAAQLWGLPKDFRMSERVAIPSDGHPERALSRSPRPLRYVFSYLQTMDLGLKE
jgi:hypothetical protein